MPENTRISFGGRKRFECQVIGYPRPTILWFKDGNNITDNNRYKFDYSIEGIITMTIEDVTYKDQGCYQCRAENCVGWAATAAYLHIRGTKAKKEDEVHKMRFEIVGTNDDQMSPPFLSPKEKQMLQLKCSDYNESVDSIESDKIFENGFIAEENQGTNSKKASFLPRTNDSGIGQEDDLQSLSSLLDVAANEKEVPHLKINQLQEERQCDIDTGSLNENGNAAIIEYDGDQNNIEPPNELKVSSDSNIDQSKPGLDISSATGVSNSKRPQDTISSKVQVDSNDVSNDRSPNDIISKVQMDDIDVSNYNSSQNGCISELNADDVDLLNNKSSPYIMKLDDDSSSDAITSTVQMNDIIISNSKGGSPNSKRSDVEPDVEDFSLNERSPSGIDDSNTQFNAVDVLNNKIPEEDKISNVKLDTVYASCHESSPNIINSDIQVDGTEFTNNEPIVVSDDVLQANTSVKQNSSFDDRNYGKTDAPMSNSNEMPSNMDNVEYDVSIQSSDILDKEDVESLSNVDYAKQPIHDKHKVNKNDQSTNKHTEESAIEDETKIENEINLNLDEEIPKRLEGITNEYLQNHKPDDKIKPTIYVDGDGDEESEKISEIEQLALDKQDSQEVISDQLLKADDKNRSRRLTGDSGIADDDSGGSSIESEEETIARAENISANNADKYLNRLIENQETTARDILNEIDSIYLDDNNEFENSNSKSFMGTKEQTLDDTESENNVPLMDKSMENLSDEADQDTRDGFQFFTDTTTVSKPNEDPLLKTTSDIDEDPGFFVFSESDVLNATDLLAVTIGNDEQNQEKSITGEITENEHAVPLRKGNNYEIDIDKDLNGKSAFMQGIENENGIITSTPKQSPSLVRKDRKDDYSYETDGSEFEYTESESYETYERKWDTTTLSSMESLNIQYLLDKKEHLRNKRVMEVDDYDGDMSGNYSDCVDDMLSRKSSLLFIAEKQAVEDQVEMPEASTKFDSQQKLQDSESRPDVIEESQTEYSENVEKVEAFALRYTDTDSESPSDMDLNVKAIISSSKPTNGIGEESFIDNSYSTNGFDLYSETNISSSANDLTGTNSLNLATETDIWNLEKNQIDASISICETTSSGKHDHDAFNDIMDKSYDIDGSANITDTKQTKPELKRQKHILPNDDSYLEDNTQEKGKIVNIMVDNDVYESEIETTPPHFKDKSAPTRLENDDGKIENFAKIALELDDLDYELIKEPLNKACTSHESDLKGAGAGLENLKDTTVEIPNTVFMKRKSNKAINKPQPESRSDEIESQVHATDDLLQHPNAYAACTDAEKKKLTRVKAKDAVEMHAPMLETGDVQTSNTEPLMIEHMSEDIASSVQGESKKIDNVTIVPETPSMTSNADDTDIKTCHVDDITVHEQQSKKPTSLISEQEEEIKPTAKNVQNTFLSAENISEVEIVNEVESVDSPELEPVDSESIIQPRTIKEAETVHWENPRVTFTTSEPTELSESVSNVSDENILQQAAALTGKHDQTQLQKDINKTKPVCLSHEQETINVDLVAPQELVDAETLFSKSKMETVLLETNIQKAKPTCLTAEQETNFEAPKEVTNAETIVPNSEIEQGFLLEKNIQKTKPTCLASEQEKTFEDVSIVDTTFAGEIVDGVHTEKVELYQGKAKVMDRIVDVSRDISAEDNDSLAQATDILNSEEPISDKNFTPPRIVNAVSDVTVQDGNILILEWEVKGFPESKLAIFKDDENITSCEWIKLKKRGPHWTMEIADAQTDDTGYYNICMKNEYGVDNHEVCVIVEKKPKSKKQHMEREADIHIPPEFVFAPANTSVQEGEPVILKCHVTGDPQPEVEWVKDGKVIHESKDIELYREDGSDYLVICSAVLQDGGEYTCQARNDFGVNQSKFALDVQEKKEEKEDERKQICPFMQLEMSESDEILSKKYLVTSDYSDNNNEVTLEQGDIIELLDKSLRSHWLVRQMKNRKEVCYVPSALLQPIQEGDEFEDIGIDIKSQGEVSEEQRLKAEARKRNSLAKLVESETDYICDLRDLMENYYDAVEEQFPAVFVERNKDVFGSLMDLYKFHKDELLPELLSSTENPVKVANLFLDKKEKFAHYVPFCAGKDKTEDVLGCEEIMQFIQACSSAIGDPDTAFGDLLSRPVDRIHEYIELLKSLIRYTTLAGGDCTELIAAVQMLTDLCREVDNLMLLDQVQGYDGNLKDFGPVIRHDKVTLWKADEVTAPEGECHIFLFPEKLVVTKIIKEAESPSELPTLEFQNVIDLKDFEINEDVLEDTKRVEFWDRYIEESDLINELTSPSITVQANNFYDKQAWVRDIKEAQHKLGVENTLKDKMPERRKIKPKTPKLVTSTPKKKDKHGEHMDNESDRSSDDFKIIDTSRDVNVSYTTPEFEDGTTRPMFKKKLQKTFVEEKSTARLECIVAGIPLPKVLWLKNNRPLKDSDKCHVIVDGDTNILQFENADRDDTGLYTARAMNANGSTISTAELYVGDVQPSVLTKFKEGLVESEFKTPAYFFQMNSCQVEEGRLARFDCRVVAYPKPDIVWMKDGKIVEPGDRHKLLNFNNEIYSLLIQNVELPDKGRYTCWAHNKYGEAMTEAYLNVIALEDRVEDEDIAPKFLTKFYDQTITDGIPAEFQCLIDGRPQPAVQWSLNDIEILPSPDILIYSENNLCALRIKEAKQKDGGKYKCHIKNSLGEASCSANLSVVDQKIKGVPVLPKFLKKIGDTNLKTEEDHTFEVVVVGEPSPKVTWLYNHKPISPTHRRYKTSQEGDIYRLTINDVSLEDDGKFTCKAVNSEGEVYCSGNVMVTKAKKVLDESEKPQFKQTDFDAKYGCIPSFMKKIADLSAPQGNDAKFECRVMGIPEPEVIWSKDGKAIKSDGHYLVSQDSSGHCYLLIKNVQQRDQGVYTCTVANPAGQTACTGQLRLGTPKEMLDRDSMVQPRRLSRESISKVQAIPALSHEKPTILDVRPDSARLSWSPASTAHLPQEARNITYIIEAKELPHGYDWKKVGSGIHGHTHLVKNLRPDLEYAFRVRAENMYGTSDASPQVIMERVKPVEVEEKIEKPRFRLPEAKKPPKLPTARPLITDMGEESLRLAWKPAVHLPTAKKALPVSYRLEAQELPGTDWLPLASRISDTSHYLPELSQDRDYNIRVRAENKYGISEPTEPLWLPRATVFPSVPISRPQIVEIEPEAVKLNWRRVEVPSYGLDESPLLYMIEMQKPPSQSWKEIACDLKDTTYYVSGLEPGQDYRFRVRARSPSLGLLEPSPAISLYRTLAASKVPIDRFELDEYEPDYQGIKLRWDQVKVPPYHRDEEPLLYMIEGQEQPLDEWRPLVSGIPTTHYRVTDLVPDRDYKFRVKALSQYGVSPPTHALPVSYRRQLPAPSRPLSVETPRLMYDDTEALQLAWKPPSVETKRPIKYKVELQAPPSLEWRPLASGIPDTKYRIQGLGPSRDYMFRVIPETTLGPLEALPPVSLTTLAAPRTTLPSRPEIFDLQPESLNLSWRRPFFDSPKPLSYRIEVQEPPRMDWRPLASDICDTSYRVTGLKQQKDYMFRVVPTTTSGSMEPLPPVSLTSMPVRPRMNQREPRIAELSKDSVKLTWLPADIPVYMRHETPVRYIVDMRSLPNTDWKTVARRVPDTSYVVQNIRPDKEYQFRVRAETDSGTSEPTLPVTVYRKPVPIFPRKEPVITGVSADSVALSWQPADIPGSAIRAPSLQYRIEAQCPPGIGPWEPVVSNIQRTSYHVTGLHPDGDYMFRVRAIADGIASEPTQPVYLTRRAAPPRMPSEQPYIYDMHPDSLKLQWRAVELPSRITDYSPVTYRVEFQEGNRYNWMVLARGIPHTDFNVVNLNPDQEYKFRIRAENGYGMGDPTPVVNVPRRAVAPTMPQEEPLIYDVGPHSVNLMWRPAEIPSYLSDGSPITYTIYALEPPGTTWQPIVRRIPHTRYHLTNIRPEQEYHFRIQAENSYGVSRPTLPVKLPRMADLRAPVEVTNILDIDDKSSSLRLQWQPKHLAPYDKVPVKYQVEAWEPRKRRWKRLASDIPDTSFRVTGLAPEDDYMFRVRAEAASLLSEPTYPISLSRFRMPSTLPPLRPQLHDLHPESVKLSWHPLHVPSYQSTRNLFPRYLVEMKEMLGRDWHPVSSNVVDTSYRIAGLKPQQDYEFRVRGVGDGGLSEPSIPVMLHRRTVIPRIPLSRPEVVGVDEDAISLRWNMVDIPAMRLGETPLSYMIEQQNLPRYDWTPIASGISDNKYKITGLKGNKDYAFRIRGEFTAGLSEPSPYVPVYRRPRILSDLVITSDDVRAGVPIARPEIWEDEPYKARLRWQRVYIPPYDQFDDVTYRIEVSQPPNRDWRPLVSGVNMTEHEVTGLAPKKDYLFRIRAESPNGDISEPTPPIAYYRSQSDEEINVNRVLDDDEGKLELSDDDEVPMARDSFKVPQYKPIEVDLTGPTRSYIDHLTTYIPPRLPVEKPELFQINPEKVTLSWKPAKVSDRIKGTSKVTYSVEVRYPPDFEWQVLASDLTTCVTDLNSLHPQVDYVFRVRAYNEYGSSEPTLPVSLYRPIELEDDDEFYSDEEILEPITIGLGEYETTIDEAPPKMPMDTPKIIDQGETAYLSWLAARIPVYAKKKPITYSVEIKEPNVPGWSHFASGITATEYFIEGLKANADYQFRVKAETQFGASEPTLPVSLNRALKAEVEETVVVEEKKAETKRPSVELKNEDFLLPVSTITNTFKTGVPPRMPSSRPLITDNRGTSLNLSWMPGRVPTYVKDYKMRYMLEVREPPGEKWRVLADNLTENSKDVAGLLPDQDYMFRVRAKNEYGMSEPTLPVAVIRERDDYVPPVLSRQGSRDSGGSPWIRSRASSVESLPKQRSIDMLDGDDDFYPSKATAPEFKSPENVSTQYGVEGKSAKISLRLHAYPLPNVTWEFNGKPLELGDRSRGFVSPSGTVTLEFKTMTPSDAGEYKCVAENEHGIAVRKVRLEEADPPMFIDPLKDLVIDSRGRGKLECRIDGIPYPTVKFMKDSRNVAESSRLKIHHEKPDHWSLTVDGAIVMDTGHYTCVAENAAGQAVSSCRINVTEHKLKEREPSYRDMYFKEANLEDHYYVLEELGRGRHGIVRRVVDKVTGKEYAAKLVHVCEAPQKHFFRHELETLRLLSHKNIPCVIDAYQTDRRLAVVMELATGGELLDRVVANDNWTESEAAYFIKQVLDVVKHLQNAKVAHLDLKPSNIHLASKDSDEIKMIDFGLSRILYKEFDVKLNYGTPGFTSPEQINTEPLTPAVDMWNVGALTYLLLSGQSSFSGNSDKDVLSKIQSCNWKFDEKAFEGVSKEAKEFISKLLVLEPSERLSVDECLEHPWIKSFTSRGQGVKINLDRFKTFHSNDKKQRMSSAVATIAKVKSLSSILNPEVPVIGFEPQTNEKTGEIVYPDSDSYGEYLDKESWYDWQNRYHQGPETKLDPLVEFEYSVPMRSYLHGDDDHEDLTDDLINDLDSELESVPNIHPQVQKECEWRDLDEGLKLRDTSDIGKYDSDKKDENPVFLVKLHDIAYNPGENITLTCQVLSPTTPVVTWFRNEELISDGSRIRTSLSDDGVATATVLSSKPYDAGVYKCIVRNKHGRAFSSARVLLGDTPSQSSRPAVTAVSSTEALLVWEPPQTDGNSPVTGYRVDYRNTGDKRWTIYGTVIDECTVVSALTPNTRYRFRVSCINEMGFGPYSVASTEIKTKPEGTPTLVLDSNVQLILSRQKLVQELPTMPSDRKSCIPVVSRNVTVQEESCHTAYDMLNSISAGKYSEMRLCKNKSTDELNSVKIVPFSPETKNSTLREYELLRTLSQEKIAQLQNCYIHSNHLYLVMEYFSGVNLLDHFSYKTKYSEEMVAMVIGQILSGMQYLQCVGVVHLNLQPSSIIMVNRHCLDLKIINFDLAQKVKDGSERVPRVGYPDFMAPEVVAREKTSYPADVWTVGTLAFLLLSGESPFAGSTEEETLANVAYSRYDAHMFYENVTREALKFVFKVLKRIPRNRMTADECLDDKWLQVSDVKVKSQREAIFTTVKLRQFADIYHERCLTGMYPSVPEQVKIKKADQPRIAEEVSKKSSESSKQEEKAPPSEAQKQTMEKAKQEKTMPPVVEKKKEEKKQPAPPFEKKKEEEKQPAPPAEKKKEEKKQPAPPVIEKKKEEEKETAPPVVEKKKEEEKQPVPPVEKKKEEETQPEIVEDQKISNGIDKEDDQFEDAVQEVAEISPKKDEKVTKVDDIEQTEKGDKIEQIATDLVSKAIDEALVDPNLTTS